MIPASSCGVLGGERLELLGPGGDVALRARAAGRAKTCCGSTLANIECIPPTGSHTLMQPKVSPW